MGVWGHKYKFQNNDPIETECFIETSPTTPAVILNTSESIWGYKYKFQNNIQPPNECYIPTTEVEPLVMIDPPDSNWGFKYKYQDGKERVNKTVYIPSNIVPECPELIDAPGSVWGFKYKFQDEYTTGCCEPIYKPSGMIGPNSSVDGQIALFNLDSGRILKAATVTGILKATNGVLSAAGLGDVNSILPSQTNANNKVLYSNGVTSYWDYAPGALNAALPGLDVIYYSVPFSGIITLSHIPVDKTERVICNGITFTPGLGEDYLLSGNQIIFNRTDFVLGDKFTVFYNYI